jgi:hypothetical protein
MGLKQLRTCMNYTLFIAQYNRSVDYRTRIEAARPFPDSQTNELVIDGEP